MAFWKVGRGGGLTFNEFSSVIREHVARSRAAHTHPAKLLVLSSLLKRRLLSEGKEPSEVLDFILDGVVGVDVNPLAVITATKL